MPIYAYRCETCGFQQDVLQKMSDARLTVCPSCANPTFQKQVTAAGFQLKGSGWYVTDFRNPAAKTGAKSEGSETKGETGGEAKGDAPATGKSGDPAAQASPPAAPAATTDAKSAPAPVKTPPASGAT